MLNHDIALRLRSGATVIIVEEADEQLARRSAELASKQIEPVAFASASDGDVIDKIAAHRTGQGTLVLSDVLRAYGTNPVVVRLIREIALQDRDKTSRLILLEIPGTDVPAVLRGDIEYIIPKVPSVKELKQELEGFIKAQDVKIAGNGETRHEIASSVAGLARHEAARLFARSWVERQALDVVWLRREKAARVAERLGGALTFIDPDVPDVGGTDGLKKWLETRKTAFISEEARKYGLPEPKGVLLLGIPGVGKSLTAKTVGKMWGLPILRLDIGKLFGSLVGQSEQQARNAIDAAEACAPCILWLDEIEKGLASGGLDGGTSQRVFGTFLTWLQEKDKPVFVVATANNIAGLPPELLRKGRFDEIFFVDLPTQQERVEIVKIHLVRRGRALKNFNVDQIAMNADGFSGAEIEQAVIEGMFQAFAQERDVKTQDILEAIAKTTPLSKTMRDQITALRSWAQGRARMASTPQKQEVPGELRRAGMGV